MFQWNTRILWQQLGFCGHFTRWNMIKREKQLCINPRLLQNLCAALQRRGCFNWGWFYRILFKISWGPHAWKVRFFFNLLLYFGTSCYAFRFLLIPALVCTVQVPSLGMKSRIPPFMTLCSHYFSEFKKFWFSMAGFKHPHQVTHRCISSCHNEQRNHEYMTSWEY